MRAFLISLTVFVLITAFVIFSSYYICQKCGSLTDLTSSFPDGNSNTVTDSDYRQSVDDFASEWSGVRPLFRYIIGHERANTVDNLREEMDSRYFSRDYSGYLSARRELISFIGIIAEDEKISLDGLF